MSSERKFRVAVVGATGYAGAELVRLLFAHPRAEVVCVTSEKDAGKPLAEVHRYLGNIDLRLSSAAADTILGAGIDIAFCALPHGTSMSLIRRLVDGGARVVDVGADFRFTDRSTYERHYGPHEEPGLMEEAVYGLTEHARERVRTARLVGNPGCYPTGALMGLIPVASLLDGTVFVDSKSGTSGAGRAAAMNQLFAEVTENLRPYGVWNHRHQPEIEEKVREAGGADARIRIAPSLLPIARGLVSACYVTSRKCEEIGERLRTAYTNEGFVRMLPEGVWPEPRSVRGTNMVELAWHVDASNGSAVIMTAIDNLGKGAAGQAVQNFNVMCGLDESTGLMLTPALP